MNQKWILVSAFFLITRLLFGQDYEAYVKLYKDIAIAEMERTGIPASIKLAQGLLESNCGKSDLACKANNHFGIKCGNDWDGKCFKKEDDDYEDGKLVKSCFREFSSVYDSYIAHSDFLTDPAKSNRYGFLFDYKPTDYKSWAKGLSKAGYATDPKYADRLVDIIEKYNLHSYDYGDLHGPLAFSARAYYPIRYFNNVKYVIAGKDDSPLSLAAQLDVRANQLLKYNDDIQDQQQHLIPGSRVYLQPKRNQFSGHQKYHVLKANEDLVLISQKYGVKLSAIEKRNGLTAGDIPATNQKIFLKGKQKTKLRLADPYAPPVQESDKNMLVSSTKSATVAAKSTIVLSKQKPPVTEPMRAKVDTIAIPPSTVEMPSPQHTVSKGETLYGIARSYGLSVDDLKKINNLSVDTLSIGQKLLVK